MTALRAVVGGNDHLRTECPRRVSMLSVLVMLDMFALGGLVAFALVNRLLSNELAVPPNPIFVRHYAANKIIRRRADDRKGSTQLMTHGSHKGTFPDSHVLSPSQQTVEGKIPAEKNQKRADA